MNIEEAAAQFQSGVPLRQIALEAHRDRVCMANAIKAPIGDKAFKEQARDNKRRGHTVRFDIASIGVSAVVRDWRLGANLAVLRARYRFPTNKRVAEAIIERIGRAEYRAGVADRCSRAAKVAWSTESYGVGHWVFSKAWGSRG